ncbi:MAG: hypothetical protein ACM3VS_12830, partial [Candidatus Dadabacteria bacterium]
MRSHNTILRNHRYTYLPAFSKFLLENYVDDLVREQLKLSYTVEIPLLEHLKHFTEEQLLELGRIGQVELLTYLAENRGKQLIEESVDKWMQDQLEIVGKFDLQADDITLINYIRGTTYRKYLPLYTSDITTAINIVDELDSFLTDSATAAMNTYIF